MPEYLAPGVFVEEVSFRSKSIEGVSTTTTGFIGPCRYGPVTEAPDILTSLTEFERSYGDGNPLGFGADGSTTSANYLRHAVASFFEEGGKRLYVSRVFRPRGGSYPTNLDTAVGATPYADGHARLAVGGGNQFRIVARYPGAYGNLQVRFGIKLGPNVLGALPDPGGGGGLIATLANLADGDVVWITTASAALNTPATGANPPAAVRSITDLPLYVAHKSVTGTWTFSAGVAPAGTAPGATTFTLADFALTLTPGTGDAIRPVTLSLEVLTADGRSLGAWSGLPLEPAHKTAGVPDGIFDLFSLNGASSAGLPIVLLNGSAPATNLIDNGSTLLQALDALSTGLDLKITQIEWDDATQNELGALRRKFERGLVAVAWLAGGNDGLLPGRAEYEGRADPTQDYATGLKQFESIEDISIVAAPGSTWAASTRPDDVAAITNLLIAHAEHMRYRIAVLDSHESMKIADVRKLKAKLDSKYAALYYPWVTVFDGVTRQPLNLPPSGFVAGIYARNDTERGVYKAPANEVVRGAIGFETLINTAQQEVLNPEGINCFRFFEGRGNRLWGARTISSDPEWKYVNLRRYFAYLERSIDKGTQWAVFEPNGEALWANVRATIRDFLVNEWANGALLGDKPEKAFFVRCDRSTMTQNDLDNGRLVCLIGVAPLKPAEFVIFRIGQWTADQKS
ncbi:MAG: phage tail sheath family protein [Burkholderiales bacterium]|nr:MAG: phage tail sheath family protein [Burkholderiales bacterium]